MPIKNLATHTAPFVTVAELADYWVVSRQQIYKAIETGALSAARLGSRLYRVRTEVALEYERCANVPAWARTESDARLSMVKDPTRRTRPKPPRRRSPDERPDES